MGGGHRTVFAVVGDDRGPDDLTDGALGDRAGNEVVLGGSAVRGRGQDDDSVIERRMAQAVDEMSHYTESDYLVVNDVFQAAHDELAAIIYCHRLRLEAQAQRYEGLLEGLLA